MHRCGLPLCGTAPCKKKEIQDYLSNHPRYDSIYFFGDGGNDLCGMSTIPQSGRIFIRKDHELHNSIREQPDLARHFQRAP